MKIKRHVSVKTNMHVERRLIRIFISGKRHPTMIYFGISISLYVEKGSKPSS